MYKCYRLTHRKQQKIGTVNLAAEHFGVVTMGSTLNSQFQFLLFSMCESITHVYKLCFYIQERNHLNVLFVPNDSHSQVTLLNTAEFTVDRNHTNVTCVTRRLVSLDN